MIRGQKLGRIGFLILTVLFYSLGSDIDALSHGQVSLGVEGPYCGDAICQVDIGETCSNCENDCGACVSTNVVETTGSGSGGGGSSGFIMGAKVQTGYFNNIRYRFYPYELEDFKVMIESGEKEVVEYLELTNIVSKEVNVRISSDEEGAFIADNSSFILSPGETKLVQMKIYNDNNFSIFLGFDDIISEIRFYGAYKEPEEFRITINIPYNELSPEDKLTAKIFFNDYKISYRTLNVFYYITDIDDKAYLIEKEVLTMNDELGYDKEFTLPSTISDGVYYLGIEVLEKNSLLASNYSEFKVYSKEKPESATKSLIFIFFVLFMILIVVLLKFVLPTRKE